MPHRGGSRGHHSAIKWTGPWEGDPAHCAHTLPPPHPASSGPGRGAQTHKPLFSTSPMCSHKHTEVLSIPDEETEAQPWPGLKRREPTLNATLLPPASELGPPCCSATSMGASLREGNMWDSAAWPDSHCHIVELHRPLSSPLPSIRSKARHGHWEG